MKLKELTQHCCSTTLNYIPGVIDLLLDDHSVVLRALQRSVLMSLFIRYPSKKAICLRWDPLLCSTDTHEIQNAWIAIIKLGLISEIIKRDWSSFQWHLYCNMLQPIKGKIFRFQSRDSSRAWQQFVSFLTLWLIWPVCVLTATIDKKKTFYRLVCNVRMRSHHVVIREVSCVKFTVSMTRDFCEVSEIVPDFLFSFVSNLQFYRNCYSRSEEGWQNYSKRCHKNNSLI